jgi:prevent-host-death family protein
MDDSYSLTSARSHLGELVSRARYSHRPIAITEHGKPSVAIINIDDLADLEDRAALADHYAARLAGRVGVPLADLDAALDQMDADDAR